MADQQFCLRWNNHQSTLISVFDSLLENGTLVDCTLAAEGQYLKAHKVVLSACSPYLEALLSQHYEKHPIVILKDVKFTELKSMMDYMYRGEVNISQDQLGTFLKAAESLQIKGLSDNGSDGDGRDVGSTSKGPPGKVQPAPSNRPAESQRPELSPPSSVHRSRDGSISPSSRKRRRIRRNSQGDDANMGDSHLDSNSCDLPNQAQSTPLVPNIPATVTSSISATPIKATIVKPEQTELVNRIDSSNLNSLPPESGLLKEKIEPISEPLLEPKTEYLDETNNDDSVEDLTLDDDDEMDEMDISNMSNMSNISRPGPSHGNDVSQMSNQGFVPWQIGNQSGTDEVFMAAQEAVQAHRNDSQGAIKIEELYWNYFNGRGHSPVHRTGEFRCECGKIYPRYTSLWNHKRYRCGKQPQFSCDFCDHKTWHKCNLKSHMAAKHSDKMDAVEFLKTELSLKQDMFKPNTSSVLPPNSTLQSNSNLSSHHSSTSNSHQQLPTTNNPLLNIPPLPAGLTISFHGPATSQITSSSVQSAVSDSISGSVASNVNSAESETSHDNSNVKSNDTFTPFV